MAASAAEAVLGFLNGVHNEESPHGLSPIRCLALHCVLCLSCVVYSFAERDLTRGATKQGQLDDGSRYWTIRCEAHASRSGQQDGRQLSRPHVQRQTVSRRSGGNQQRRNADRRYLG